MEGLIALLVEGIAALVAPLFAAAASLLGALLSLVIELVAWAARLVLGIAASKESSPSPPPPSRSTLPPSPSPPPSRPHPPTSAVMPGSSELAAGGPLPRRRWPRRLLLACIAASTLALGAGAVVEAFFAEEVLAWGVRRWERRSGASMEWQRSSTSLLRGTVELTSARLVSPPGGRTTYALAIAHVRLDVSVLAIIRGELAVEEAAVSGVRGSFASDLDTPGAPSPGRDLLIERLLIEDAQVDLSVTRRGRTLEGPVSVERWETAPMRRRSALFDALFRTQAHGTLLGAPFTIASAPADNGRRTRWTATGLPAELLAAYVGGPLAWIADGTVDVEVDDAWSLDAPKYLRMDWRLRTHRLALVPAEELSGLPARVVSALAPRLAERGGELDLRWQLDADPERFATAQSLDATGVGDLVASALANALAEELGIAPERVREAASGAFRWGRGVIDRWRGRAGKPPQVEPRP